MRKWDDFAACHALNATGSFSSSTHKCRALLQAAARKSIHCDYYTRGSADCSSTFSQCKALHVWRTNATAPGTCSCTHKESAVWGCTPSMQLHAYRTHPCGPAGNGFVGMNACNQAAVCRTVCTCFQANQLVPFQSNHIQHGNALSFGTLEQSCQRCSQATTAAPAASPPPSQTFNSLVKASCKSVKARLKKTPPHSSPPRLPFQASRPLVKA